MLQSGRKDKNHSGDRCATLDTIMTNDLTILGGGLAGLSLALQVRQQLPDAKITVLEKRQHPVPEAAHKVGESTVEVAAHYFGKVLGLKQHIAD